MQALLENEVVSLYRQENIISEFDSLMESAKTADAVLKAKIENDIVAAGTKFIPELVSQFSATTLDISAQIFRLIPPVTLSPENNFLEIHSDLILSR